LAVLREKFSIERDRSLKRRGGRRLECGLCYFITVGDLEGGERGLEKGGRDWKQEATTAQTKRCPMGDHRGTL